MRSKEDCVLELFFNTPKHWHFDQLLRKSGLSRSRLAAWLTQFRQEGLIERKKSKGKMPYYVAKASPLFLHRKRLYAQKQLTTSGLLAHLASLKASVIIVFGSFTRGDWYIESDIDIFIYGDDDAFEQGLYEKKLNREIQVHTAKNKNELKSIEKMLPYIIQGDFVKGSLDDLGVRVYAET
ncbi:MAG: nucleotidyltransferase domain-containing protein [Candidatus Woesearchaeota archaeon]|nr:nucleotidyltransferase domain-containing protein [Candidatus Woesearchaeota archaeon]